MGIENITTAVKGKFRALLAVYIVTLSFGFIFMITLSETAQKAETNQVVLGFLLGTGLAAIIACYFGGNEPATKIE